MTERFLYSAMPSMNLAGGSVNSCQSVYKELGNLALRSVELFMFI